MLGLGRVIIAVLSIVCTLGATAQRSLAGAPPALSARGAALIEESTGQELYGSGAQRELSIASTTKLMTALVSIEHARLGRIFTQNDYVPAPIDSQIGLVPGERMSVHDLLLAVLLPSGDDAAEDLAYNVGHGSVARFIAMMNARARQLHLSHTQYSTPAGLDAPGNYSTAADLVKLASFILERHPFLAHAVALASAVLRTGNHVRVVQSTNDLLGRVPWIDGVKTGHTLDAGYVLVASGTRGRLRLLSAVLGTPTQSARDASTLALLGYGFANFRLVTPVLTGAVVARPNVRDRPGLRVDVIADSVFKRVVGRSVRVTTRLELPRQLAGPLPRHAVVGTLLVLADGMPIARVPLLLARPLAAVGSLTLVGRFIARPSTLVALAVMLTSLVTLVLAVRRRGRVGAGRSEAAQA